MITEVLQSLGLSPKEMAVYTAIFENGKLTPARIAKITNLHRTTVYGLCHELEQKGFVHVDESKGLIYVSPIAPDDLAKIAKRERHAIAQKEELIDELAKLLKEQPQSKTYAIPKVKFVEGEQKVEEYLFAQTPTWFKNAHEYDGTFVGFQDHSFVEHEPYRKWVEWCTKRSDFVDTRLLSNDTEVEGAISKDKLRARTVKFWGEVTDFSASQWITGDYSIMVITRQKPHYLVEMRDAVYTSNMRKFFLGLWNSLP